MWSGWKVLGAVTACGVAVFLGSTEASGQEKLLVDTGAVQYPHAPNIISQAEYHHGWVVPHFDWTSPVNYLDGTLYQYVEIARRPTNRSFSMQPILDETRQTSPCGNDPKALNSIVNGHHWGLGTTVTDPGVYTTSKPLRQLRDATNLFTTASMSNPPCMRMLIANQYSPGNNIPFTDADFYPTTVRVLWVIAAQGATFSGWQNYVGSGAPRITSSPVTTTPVGQPYTYDVNATGSPAPTYSLSTGPAGMTLDSTTGVVSWTPLAAGSYSVTVVASNGTAPDSTQSYSISVTAGGGGPPAGGGGGGSNREGTEGSCGATGAEALLALAFLIAVRRFLSDH